MARSLHPLDEAHVRQILASHGPVRSRRVFLHIYRKFCRNQERATRRLPKLSRNQLRDFGPSSNFGALYGLSEGDFKDHFIFTPTVFMRVFRELRFPESIEYEADGQQKVSSMTAFLIFLKRMRTSSSRLADLKFFFNRSAAWIAKVFRACLAYLYLNHAKRRVGVFDPHVFNELRLRGYQEGCTAVGSFLETVCGFVDGTCDPISRPHYGGHNANAQNAVPSGRLLYEMMMFPDGLVGRAFGPLAGGNRHRTAIEAGGCRDLVRDHFHGYALYGDSTYFGYEPEIIPPFTADEVSQSREMNLHMSAVRVSIDSVIDEIYQLCPILHRNFKIGSEPAGPIFLTACFLYNVHVCATRCPGSCARFGVPPPLLDEYLHPLPPLDDGQLDIVGAVEPGFGDISVDDADEPLEF